MGYMFFWKAILYFIYYYQKTFGYTTGIYGKLEFHSKVLYTFAQRTAQGSPFISHEKDFEDAQQLLKVQRIFTNAVGVGQLSDRTVQNNGMVCSGDRRFEFYAGGGLWILATVL
ncbi:MAG: hypothetical protein IKE58_01380 [Blautia sp.]|nr:hypothetical protein [Blautia sp.]